MTKFSELGLSEHAMAAIQELGYTDPTPVQEQAIPHVLAGKDLIAAAKTGTGKTAAFALPGMDRIGRPHRGKKARKGMGPYMLVVTPTRELAQQIGEVCQTIASQTKHHILTVVGGLSYGPQITRLKMGVEVLIATPGRLIDLMDQGAVNLDQVKVLVLDEADRMLDMGFWPMVKKIVAATPEERQTLLFSATVDDAVRKSVGTLLHDPAYVEIARHGETADTIDQYVVRVPHTLKPALLKAVLEDYGSQRVMVFARTRGRTDTCARRLRRAGFTVEAIHSDRSQNQRRRALDAFASGEVDIIVATDVLARGIDVEEVNYVVNFDIPHVPEDYVHRIGRTGRAGHTGFAVSFVDPDTEEDLRAIEKLTKQKIPELEVKSYNQKQAAEEATQATLRKANRKDPELAAAIKETNKRKRKKEKAKERAAEEAAQAVAKKQGKKTRTRRPKVEKAVEVQVDPRLLEEPKRPRTEKPAARQSAARAAKAASEHKPATRKQKKHVAAKTSKPDMRPGRAHRAEVAKMRGKRTRS